MFSTALVSWSQNASRRSVMHGSNTSKAVEVRSISPDGVTITVDGRELYLPYGEFPWFEEAPVSTIRNIERPSPDHLYWPDLDVDLTLDSIEHPENHPLKSK